MALIMCPECGKEFSSLAKCCPNCACPTEAILRMTGGDGGSAPEAVDPGLEFTPSTGGRSYSVRKYKGKSRDLVIPSTYKGKPVTEIWKEAFKGHRRLLSVKIPNSVTSIGSSAFDSCSGLASITVEKGNPIYHSAGNCLIETESKTLLVGCKNSIIPSDRTVTSIGGAFWGCTGLTSITIPDSVMSIGNGAFCDCTRLTSITIPDSVTSIGVFAFSSCSGLTSVTIGSGVTSIGSSAFDSCSGLTSVTIPDGVTSIGSSAFSSCSGLTSVTIGSGVTSIGGWAFRGCTRLTSITIPDSVTSIGYWAFKDCTALTEITFLGTEEEWNAIEKGKEWDKNLGKGSYHIHFVAEAQKGFDDFDF